MVNCIGISAWMDGGFHCWLPAKGPVSESGSTTPVATASSTASSTVVLSAVEARDAPATPVNKSILRRTNTTLNGYLVNCGDKVGRFMGFLAGCKDS